MLSSDIYRNCYAPSRIGIGSKMSPKAKVLWISLIIPTRLGVWESHKKPGIDRVAAGLDERDTVILVY